MEELRADTRTDIIHYGATASIRRFDMDFLNSKLFVAMEGIGSLAVLSALWILFCIPVITVIPATAALYYAAAKSVRRGYGYPAAEFFHCFKQNWKQGIVINFGLLILVYVYWFIFHFIRYVGFSSLLGQIYSVFLAVSVIMTFLVLFYLLPVITRFTVSMPDAIRIALVMGFRNLKTLIPLMVTAAAAACLIYTVPFLILIIPGMYAWLMSFSVEQSLRKFVTQQLEDPEQYNGAWFMEKSEKENVHILDYFRSLKGRRRETCMRSKK